jgi:uncharacterized protein (TIGR00369 family)
LEVALIDEDDPEAGISLVAGNHSVNAVDYLHGGAISTVLDVAAYLAVLAELSEEEEAITHNLFVSYLAAVKGSAQLSARGTLIRRSRRLAFVASELREEDRLVATAQVTKSIVQSGG